MSNLDKNIIITPNNGSSTADPNIVFTGGNTTVANSINMTMYASGTLSWDGTAGQLFSITNSLTGTIFSVNDISGIPSITVNSLGNIVLAQYSGNVTVGAAQGQAGNVLSVAGNLYTFGNSYVAQNQYVVGNIVAYGSNDLFGGKVGIGTTSTTGANSNILAVYGTTMQYGNLVIRSQAAGSSGIYFADGTFQTSAATSTDPAGNNTEIQFNNSGVFGASSNLTWNGTTLNATILKSTQSSGDEGGQIDLAIPAANTSINSGVAIDVFQNRLRFFETGGTNRGYYLDITSGAAAAATNLLAAASGSYSNLNVASYLSGPVVVGNLTVNNTTASTSTLTGALLMGGGAGIQGAVHIGGLIYGASTLNIAGAARVNSLTSNGAVSGTTGTFTGAVYAGSFNTAGTATVNALVSNGTITATTITGTAGTFTSLQSSGTATVNALVSNGAITATTINGTAGTFTSIQNSGTTTTNTLVSNGAISGTTITGTAGTFTSLQSSGTATVSSLVSNGAISGTSATVTSLQSSGIATVNALVSNGAVSGTTGTFTGALYGASFNSAGTATVNALVSNTDVKTATVNASSTIVGANIYSNGFVQAAGTITGQTVNSNTTITAGTGLTVTSGGMSVTGTSSFTGNINVTGNLNVTGAVNSTASNILVVQDPLIYVGANNPSDLYDLGIVGSYTEGSYYNTGIVRNHNDNFWTVFDTLTSTPNVITGNINWSDSTLTYGPLKAGNIAIVGTTVSTNTTTGALTITGTGGVGIGGRLNVGGSAWFASAVNAGGTAIVNALTSNGAVSGTTGTFTGALYGSSFNTAGTATVNALVSNGAITGTTVTGTAITATSIQNSGLERSANIVSNTWIHATQNLTVASSNTSTTTGTGALVVSGGVGIAGNINVGGSNNLFTNKVGVGTSAALGASSNVLAVYGSENLFGNLVIANTAAGGSGIYFPDGTYQQTASAVGGVNQSVQFNDNGIFGGTTDFIYDKTNFRLGIGTTNLTNSLSIFSATAALFNTTNGADQQIIVGNAAAYGAVLGFNSSSGSGANTYGYLSAVGAAAKNISVTATGTGIGGVTIPQNTLEVGGTTIIGTSYSGNNSFINPPSNGLAVQGSVGVGTFTPVSKLDVRGSGAFTGVVNIGGATSVASLVSNGAVSGTTGTFTGALYSASFNSAGTATVNALVSNGAISGTSITGTAITATSIQNSGTETVNALVSNVYGRFGQNVTVNSTNASTSTTTGAIVTAGGIGAAGALHVGGLIYGASTLNIAGAAQVNSLISNGAVSGTTGTFTSALYAGSFNSAGTATVNALVSNGAVSGTTGTFTSALYGASFNTAGTATVNALVSNGAVSGTTGTFTGALYAASFNTAGTATVNSLVSNGAISGTTINGTALTVTSIQNSGTTTTNALISNIYGLFGQNVTVNSTNASTSTTTGALILAGGAGIGGNINVGGAISAFTTGNVGIGISAPISKLHTYQTITSTLVPAVTLGAAYSSSSLSHGLAFSINNNAPSAGVYVSDGGGAGSNLLFTTATSYSTPTNIERMRIDYSGSVGIGTTPSTKLDVFLQGHQARFGSSSGNNTMQVYSSGGTMGMWAGGDAKLYSNTGMIFWTGATVGTGIPSSPTGIMTLDAAGNLGIGVTPNSWFSSIKAIDINTVGSMAASTNAVEVYMNSYFDTGGTFRYRTTNVATKYEQSLGAHKWYTAPSGTAGAAITFTQAMTLDANGHLAIQDGKQYFWGTGRTAIQGTSASDVMQFFTASVERMRIDSSGNVGVATTTIQTGYNFQVQGNAAFTNRIGIGTSAIAGITNAAVIYGTAMVYGNLDLGNPAGGTSGIYFADGTYQTTAAVTTPYYSNTNVASYLSGPVQVGNLTINNTTTSTSTLTGALLMGGGAGIQGAVHVGGLIYGASTLNIAGAAQVNSFISNGAISGTTINGTALTVTSIQNSGTTTTNALISNVYGRFGQNVTVNSTNASTSTATGAIVTAGGIGAAGALHVGGLIYGASTLNIAGAARVNSLVSNGSVTATTYYGASDPAYQLTPDGFSQIKTTYFTTSNTVNGFIQVSESSIFGADSGSSNTFVFSTTGDSWIKTIYKFGVGTDTPLSKLDVRGGVGVTAASNFGGAVAVASLTSNSAISGTTVTGTAITATSIQNSGLERSANIVSNTWIHATQNLTVASSNASTTTGTGAAVITGGVGIGGALNVGGGAWFAGTVNAGGTAVVNALTSNGIVSGSTLIGPAAATSSYLRITNPGGAEYTTTTSTVTGAIQVTLPVGATDTMVAMTIKVYEYVTNESFEIHCGGYIYNLGNTWANNPFAYIVSNPGIDRRFTVRFGYTSTSKMCVYIGELASTWSYPQVTVTDVQLGYAGYSATWATGWAISFQASAFENVTATITNPQVGYGTSTNTVNALVLRDASGNFSAGTGTYTGLQNSGQTLTNSLVSNVFARFGQNVEIDSSNASTSSTNGALVVAGGAGVAGNVNVGGTRNLFTGAVGVGTTTAAGMIAGAGVTNDAYVWGNVRLANTATTSSGIIFPDGTRQTTAATGSGSGTSFGAAGTIQFAGAANTFTGDTANFFWDDTNNRLGLGASTTPASTLDVRGSVGVTAASNFGSSLAVGSLASNGAISGTTINGTAATFTSLQVSGTTTTNALVSNVYGVFGQNVTINSTNTSTSTTTGALVVDGGIGAAGNLNVGGNITTSGNITGVNTLGVTIVGIGTSTIDAATKLSLYGGNLRIGSTGTGIVFPDGTFQASAAESESIVRRSFTATAGQTTFTGSYTVGSIDVYQNGSKLNVGTDVTASNGTSIVLTIAAESGDIIETVSNTLFNVANAITTAGGTVGGQLSITNATDSTSTITGALTVTGGTGIAGKLNVGGSTWFAGTVNVGGQAIVNSLVSNTTVGVGGTVINGFDMTVSGGTLSTVANSNVSVLNLRTLSSNEDYLEFLNVRNTVGGTDWNTSGYRIQQRIDSTFMGWVGFNSGFGSDAFSNPGGIAFGTGLSTVGPNSVSERMRIISNGNVGIGTTAPVDVFHVYSGNLTVGNPAGNTTIISSNYITLTRQGNVPAPPASGDLQIFDKNVGTRSMLSQQGASGIDTSLQPLIGKNRVYYWAPVGLNTTTAPTASLSATAFTAVGTATARAWASTNIRTRMTRMAYTSVTTVGGLASLRVATAWLTTGTGTGLGGFFYICRFGVSDAATVAAARMFVGLSATTAAATNVDPAGLLNSIGVAQISTDATQWYFICSGSAAQAATPLGTALGAPTLTTTSWDLALFSSPGSNGVVGYTLTNIGTGVSVTGSITPGTPGTQTPANTTALTPQIWRTNNTTALAVAIDFMSLYIETDD